MKCELSLRKVNKAKKRTVLKCVRKGVGVGVKTSPLSLIFYENFITGVNEINCFRILFAC